MIGKPTMDTQPGNLFSELTRRSFLKAASTVAAAGALTDSLDLLAQAAGRYTGILIPAGAHPAMRSAAEMLASKLGLKPDAIKNYSGAAKLRKSFVILALKDTKGAPASLTSAIARDGYGVFAQNGGMISNMSRRKSSPATTSPWDSCAPNQISARPCGSYMKSTLDR